MLPRYLLLYFASFSLAADTAIRANYPASDLRELSQEDLVELDEFLSRVQQVLHPKDTVVDKLESVQAPFARLVAKLANVPPAKPLHRLTRKVRKNDEAFVALDDVAAAADSLAAEQRESYLSMRLLLDALFGIEDVDSDGESGSDSDSDSDEEDAEEEEEEEEVKEDEEGDEEEADEGEEGEEEEGEAGEDGEEGDAVDGGEGETGEGAEEDLDDYDWFYRIFGSKDRGARAAVTKNPGVASLELAALAKRPRAVNRAVKRVVAAQAGEAQFKAATTQPATTATAEPVKTEPATTKSTGQPTSTKLEEARPSAKSKSKSKSKSKTKTLSAEHVKSETAGSTSTSLLTVHSSTKVIVPSPTPTLAYVESSSVVEPSSVALESSTLKVEYSVPEETPVPEQAVPEETAPAIVGPEESDACNLTFGNWSWACAPTTSAGTPGWSAALFVVVGATALFAIFLV